MLGRLLRPARSLADGPARSLASATGNKNMSAATPDQPNEYLATRHRGLTYLDYQLISSRKTRTDKGGGGWSYRPAIENTREEDPMTIKLPGYAICVFMCAQIMYHMYWDWQVVAGEFVNPYPEMFTDEELGIPPDDA